MEKEQFNVSKRTTRLKKGKKLISKTTYQRDDESVQHSDDASHRQIVEQLGDFYHLEDWRLVNVEGKFHLKGQFAAGGVAVVFVNHRPEYRAADRVKEHGQRVRRDHHVRALARQVGVAGHRGYVRIDRNLVTPVFLHRVQYDVQFSTENFCYESAKESKRRRVADARLNGKTRRRISRVLGPPKRLLFAKV